MPLNNGQTAAAFVCVDDGGLNSFDGGFEHCGEEVIALAKKSIGICVVARVIDADGDGIDLIDRGFGDGNSKNAKFIGESKSIERGYGNSGFYQSFTGLVFKHSPGVEVLFGVIFLAPFF